MSISAFLFALQECTENRCSVYTILLVKILKVFPIELIIAFTIEVFECSIGDFGYTIAFPATCTCCYIYINSSVYYVIVYLNIESLTIRIEQSTITVHSKYTETNDIALCFLIANNNVETLVSLLNHVQTLHSLGILVPSNPLRGSRTNGIVLIQNYIIVCSSRLIQLNCERLIQLNLKKIFIYTNIAHVVFDSALRFSRIRLILPSILMNIIIRKSIFCLSIVHHIIATSNTVLQITYANIVNGIVKRFSRLVSLCIKCQIECRSYIAVAVLIISVAECHGKENLLMTVSIVCTTCSFECIEVYILLQSNTQLPKASVCRTASSGCSPIFISRSAQEFATLLVSFDRGNLNEAIQILTL